MKDWRNEEGMQPNPHDNARGTIVAGVNDRHEPFVGIVTRCVEGGALNGEDLWTIRDSLGDEADFIASQVIVVDDERIEELRDQLQEAT